MPNLSFANVIRQWEALLTAADEHALDLARIEHHRTALRQHLAATRAVKARQDSARAAKQRATQELEGMVELGNDLARALRHAAQSELGAKNELLVQFGVMPIRKRGRRADREAPAAAAESPAAPPPADGAAEP
jgi:hypothetical protein